MGCGDHLKTLRPYQVEAKRMIEKAWAKQLSLKGLEHIKSGVTMWVLPLFLLDTPRVIAKPVAVRFMSRPFVKDKYIVAWVATSQGKKVLYYFNPYVKLYKLYPTYRVAQRALKALLANPPNITVIDSLSEVAFVTKPKPYKVTIQDMIPEGGFKRGELSLVAAHPSPFKKSDLHGHFIREKFKIDLEK